MTRRRILRAVSIACAVTSSLSALVLGACQWMVPFTIEESAARGADAGDATTAKARACARTLPQPPQRGATTEPQTEGTVFAPYAIRVRPPTADDVELCDTIGFDFDGLATGGPGCTENRSCIAYLGGSPTAQCDQPEGRDDTLIEFIKRGRQIPALAPYQENTDPTLLAERGIWNTLLQVFNYNGEDDDDDVVVSFYSAAGIDGVDASLQGRSQIKTEDEIRAVPVVWDGGQDYEWIVDETSFVAGTDVQLPAQTAFGYVKGGVLVIPDTGPGLISLGIPSAGVVPYVTGTLSAHVDRSVPNRLRLLFGRMSFRVASSELLRALASLELSMDDAGRQLCEPVQSTTYKLVRAAACGHLDLPPTGQPADASVMCGEASLSFVFAAVEQRLKYYVRQDGQRFIAAEGSRHGRLVPCLDEAGTIFCDDCARDESTRCPIGDAGSE